MHGVQRRLVARIGVDRRHEALFDADGLVEDLGDRCKAVGRARSVGDDLVVLGQLVVVDAIDDGQVGAVGRSRNDDALGAGFQMHGGLVTRGEDAGAFERDVDAFGSPWQFGRVADGVNLDRAVAHIDRVASDLHFLGETAMHAVVAQQMRIGFDRAEVVDRHDLNIGAARLDDGAKNVAADAAKTVDCDANCHFLLISRWGSASCDASELDL